MLVAKPRPGPEWIHEVKHEAHSLRAPSLQSASGSIVGAKSQKIGAEKQARPSLRPYLDSASPRTRGGFAPSARTQGATLVASLPPVSAPPEFPLREGSGRQNAHSVGGNLGDLAFNQIMVARSAA
jgi:hypothetical protein